MMDHGQVLYLLIWISALWLVAAVFACWVTRAVVLDRAAAAELGQAEELLAGRHRIRPDDSGGALARADTVPLSRLRVNFASGPAVIERQPPLRELTAGRHAHSTGRTTDWIRALGEDTDRFIAAMGEK